MKRGPEFSGPLARFFGPEQTAWFRILRPFSGVLIEDQNCVHEVLISFGRV